MDPSQFLTVFFFFSHTWGRAAGRWGRAAGRPARAGVAAAEGPQAPRLVQLLAPLSFTFPEATSCLLELQVGVWKEAAPEFPQMSHKVTSACISVATPGAGRAGACGPLVEHDFTQNIIGVLLQRRKEGGFGPSGKPSQLWRCRRCGGYQQNGVVLCEDFQHK